MSFTSPLGLLAGLAIPVVLALHLFRRQLKERRVAGVFLFTAARLRAEAGRKRTRLLQSPSLWLELLAAALLTLLLGGLSFGASSSSTHLVFVLDDSASMGAEDGEGELLVRRAVRRMGELVEDAGSGAFVTLVTTGPRPEVLLGPRALVGQVSDALEGWRPWRTSHDVSASFDLALELAGADGEVWFMTDREAVDAPPSVSVAHFGDAGSNAAILSAARRAVGTGQEKIFCDVAAFGSNVMQGEIEVVYETEAGPRSAARRDVELTPGRPTHLSFEAPANDWPCRLQLHMDADRLAVDNAFTLLAEPPRTVGLASTLSEEDGARLALKRFAAAQDGVVYLEDVTRAHLVVCEEPSAAATRQEIVLRKPKPPLDPWIGPYLVDRRHELVAGLSLDGVVWSSGREPLPGEPLVMAGQKTLIGLERQQDRFRIWLDLDISRTNLVSAPDWPILLANASEAARELLPGAVSPNVLAGNLMRWRTSEDAESLVLSDPDGLERPGRGRRVVAWESRRTGIHELRQAGEMLGRFAVNFSDATESDLDGASTGEQPGAVEDAEQIDETASGRFEARLLLLLLLLAVVLDWWVLARGRA